MNKIIFVISFIFAQCVGAQPHTTEHQTLVAGAVIYKQSSPRVIAVNNFVQQLFQWIDKSCQQTELLSEKEVQKYFHNDFNYYVNDKLMTSNIEQFIKRHQKLRAQYKDIRVTKPIEPNTISGSQFAVTYKVNKIDLAGVHYQDQITVIAKLEDNKIKTWHAVIEQMA